MATNGVEKSARLLIIDDDIDLLEALQSGIEIPGYQLEVTVATDGQAGIEAISKFLPDVVLVDFNMPKKDGFLVVDEIKKDPKLRKIRIIMITAEDTKDRLWESIDREIDDFIGKPFDLLELEARIFHQLELSKA